MTEETNPLTPLSNYDIEGEGSESFANPSNKRSKNITSGNTVKKVKTLDKTDKHKSWVWKWCDPILLDNGKIFVGEGRGINEAASKQVKVLVVGNPCNTNCYIAMNIAKNMRKGMILDWPRMAGVMNSLKR